MNNYREISAQVFAEKFLQILSNPKNSSVKDTLSDGIDNQEELGYNEYQWNKKGNE